MSGRGNAIKALALVSQVWRFLARDGVRVLAYHDVADPVSFRRQMAHLSESYMPLGQDDLIAAIEGGSLPSRACWVTFDDGDPTVISHGLPVLEELGIQATLFVCPGVIDTDEPYWWQVAERATELGLTSDVGMATVAEMKRVPDDLRMELVALLAHRLADHLGESYRREQLTSAQLGEWVARGQSVGNHTWTHPLLDMCGSSEQIRQIDSAHEWLVARVGPMKTFAYPNGNHTAEAEECVRGLGYRIGVMFDHRVDHGENPLTMARIRVNSDDPLEEFRMKVAGLHPWLHHSVLGRA